MCDKKNSVLFTDTECVVLSPDFKLLDESQVLLRVPKKNNKYCIDLKNVSLLRGLTCLFAKATLDESNLWHMRLRHINFKTINKLVRRNLARGSKNTEDNAGKKVTKVPEKEIGVSIARIEEIRLFLAYASFKDFVVYQMDVKSEFLYGTIEVEVYVCQTLGFEDPKLLDRVYKVEKALYGLHQASRAWSTRKEMCTEFEKLMHKKFQMSSIRELTFFLGLQVTQKDDKIFISQDKPDIKFAVCVCTRFQVTSNVSQLNAVKRIFRYLKAQPKLGIWYPKDSPFNLEAYTDSDFAGASLDRKSTI
nr:hypothetical protein [Tanacetum cinerariifolium]